MEFANDHAKVYNITPYNHRGQLENRMTEKKSFFEQMASLPANFWVANFMEILERFAFYGVRAISALYLVASAGDKGLGLDYNDKANIYMVWALLQCLIPMVSGGFTERYGYRKSLVVAFTLNICGYLGMAYSLPIGNYVTENLFANGGFWIFMASACFVGTGTAIFKPPVHGTIAKTTTEETSSLGWGVFYWVVNIGGALGPIGAAVLRAEIDWDHVFIAAAIVTGLNFIPAFLMYKEPEKEPPKEGEDAPKGAVGVFISSIVTILKDFRLVVFLLIFSCFWLMFMQLWDLLPNFIDEWIDTSDVAPIFKWFSDAWVLESGQVKPEMIINIDAISIIALVIFISWIVRKINKVAAMVIGMVISLVGFVGAGATNIGVLCCIMIFVFSIGEMACSPTFSAYVAVIAPKDKKALYMGYSNIPFAIGWAAGNKIGGAIYESISSKFNLAREYMVQVLNLDAGLVMDEEKLPKEEVMNKLAEALGGPEGSVTIREATQVLWDYYDPQMVWYYLGIFGIVGTVGMIIFYFMTRKTVAANS